MKAVFHFIILTVISILFSSCSSTDQTADRDLAGDQPLTFGGSPEPLMEITPASMLKIMRDSGKLDPFAKQFDETIRHHYRQSPKLAETLSKQFMGYVAKVRNMSDKDFQKIDMPLSRLLTLTMAQLAHGREFLLQKNLRDTSETKIPQARVFQGEDLTNLLGPSWDNEDQKCTHEPPMPSLINPDLPEVRYGHYANETLSSCEIQHSNILSEILTALSASNGSSVLYKRKKYTDAHSLIEALMAHGHHVILENQRSHANFISLTLELPQTKPIYLRWPVWIDTGIKMKNGKSLSIPMTHTQHTWTITGPDVRARFAFFLGIDGVGFFPQTTKRPLWTGSKNLFSTEDKQFIVDSIRLSSIYMKRNHTEQRILNNGKRLPTDGYGVLGVCNDSTAAVEGALLNLETYRRLANRPSGPSIYPLLRSREIDNDNGTRDIPLLKDGLDEIIRALPHDIEDQRSRADSLARIIATTPIWDRSVRWNQISVGTHSASESFWDPLYAAQLQELMGAENMFSGK